MEKQIFTIGYTIPTFDKLIDLKKIAKALKVKISNILG